MRTLLSFALCLLCPLTAQSPKATPAKPEIARKSAPAKPNKIRPLTIVTLEFRGSEQFSQAALLKFSGLQTGLKVLPDELEAAQQKLLDSEFFQKVTFEYRTDGANNTKVTYLLQDLQPAIAIRFEELPLTDAELKAKLSQSLPLFTEKIPPLPSILKAYAAALEKATDWPSKNPKIRGFVMDEAEPYVLFRPNSSRTTVAEVEFSGNKALDPTELRGALALATIGTVWSEPRFRQLLDFSIRPLYEQKGIMRVTFPEVRAEPFQTAEKRGVKVFVTIVESEPYGFGQVTLQNTGVKTDKLVKEVGLLSTDIYDYRKEKKLADALEQVAKTQGYFDARATVTREIDDAKKRVNLKATVENGRLWRFGRLFIKGLDVVVEPAIRKLWSIKAGAAFSYSYPDFFLQELRNRGELDNLGKTRAEFTRDETEGWVDVTLHFEPLDKPLPRAQP
jgi:outer membrane protein insertion porin family